MDRLLPRGARLGCALLIAALSAGPALADMVGEIVREGTRGAMSVTLDGERAREELVFEPYQMRGDLLRDDIVLLMRHGPTDWSRRDPRGVDARDCAAQRRLSPEGARAMRDLGILMAGNGLVPGRIVSSEWCRAQSTVQNLVEGMSLLDRSGAAHVPVETGADASLLLSLGGPDTVTALRERIRAWEGGGTGPLLIVSHFTNIAELTEFSVYEGEALVLDPKLDGRVLGYLRLRSAAPDVGHFD